MSYDCDYLLIWESQPYLLNGVSCDDIPGVAMEDIKVHDKSRKGLDFAQLKNILYIACMKYGLPLDDIKFRIPPDQIFERCNGGCFKKSNNQEWYSAGATERATLQYELSRQRADYINLINENTKLLEIIVEKDALINELKVSTNKTKELIDRHVAFSFPTDKYF